MVEQRSGAEISFIKKALLDYPAVADREHRDFAVWSALPGMGDQHVGEQRKVITGHERPVETQVLYAVGRTPAQVLLTHRFDAAALGIATVRQRARFDADHVFGPVLLAGGAEFSGQPQQREVGGHLGSRRPRLPGYLALCIIHRMIIFLDKPLVLCNQSFIQGFVMSDGTATRISLKCSGWLARLNHHRFCCGAWRRLATNGW